MTVTLNALKQRLQALDADPQADVRQKIAVLNDIAHTLRDSDPAAGLVYGQRAYHLSRSGPFAVDHDRHGLANSLLQLGVCHYLLGHYQQVLEQLFEAQPLAETLNDSRLQAEILLTLAQTYNMLGDLPVALNHVLDAIAMCRKAHYYEGEALAHNTQGIIYHKLGNLHQALAAFQNAVRLHRETGDQTGEGRLLNDLAMEYLALADYENALHCARQGLQLARRIRFDLLEANVLCTTGEIHLAQGNVDEAQDFFRKSLTLARTLGLTYLEMYAQMSMGQAYVQIDQIDQALISLHQALALAQKIDTKSELSQCHQLLAQAYKRQGDFETALHHHEQYHAVYRDIFNTESNQRVRNLQIVHATATAQKEAEIYRLRSVELEREVTERKRVQEELEHLVEELRAFSYTVAHDLKNPLTMIIGFVEMLQDSDTADLPESLRLEWLQRVADGANRMQDIIDALLLLATVRETDHVRLGTVDMAPLVRDVVSQLRPDDSQAQITVADSWPLAQGYAPWIKAVWSNYISNALKYGGQPPMIELGAEVQPDGMVRYWVRDNGPGLTREEQAQLFTPFTRLHHNQAEGHGLGLAIVQRIVQKLGGYVGINSTPGAGSTFSFTLPAAD